MGILRLESLMIGSSSGPEFHGIYYKKMWMGVWCMVILGGDVGTCLRILNEDPSNIPVHEADQAAVTTSLAHNSSKLLPRTSKKLEQSAMEFQSNVSQEFEFRCEREDLTIVTHTTKYLPNGMPTYGVQITNTCLECCLVDVHVACGDWASGTLVNPHLFRRVTEDDCLVNDGNAIVAQEVFFFEYTSSFPYTLSSRSVTPVCL